MRTLLAALLAALAFALAGCTDADAGSLATSGGGAAPGVAASYTDKTLAEIEALTCAVGEVGYPTDSPHVLLCRSAGTWTYTIEGQEVTPSLIADWPTSVTPGSAPAHWTATDREGMATVEAYGANVRGLFRTLPSAPYTITIRFRARVSDLDYNAAVIIMRQSSDGLARRWGVREYGSGAAGTARIYNLDATWAISGGILDTIPEEAAWGIQCVQIQDDETNVTFSWSRDCVNYSLAYSVGRTTYITANQIGISPYPYQSGTAAGQGTTIQVVSYTETNP